MTDDDMLGETSKEGARRMSQLRQASLSCGPSSLAFIDPTTASLAYLAPTSSQYRGHLVTTLASTIPPRRLPVGQPGFLGKEISISPEGTWVTVFHPHSGQTGGVLAMYDSSVLSPVSITGKVVPIATFNLSSAPLATIHNHSPRIHTAQGRGRAIGPRILDDHETHGPSITVVCTDGIYLFHPFQIISPSLIGAPMDSSQSAWRMQMLKCPFHSRFRAVLGGQLAEDTGLRAKRAWIGAVGASEAIWVGIEVKMEVRVIRVGYEQDDTGRFSMTTVPLPTLSSHTPEAHQNGVNQDTELQGLVFVSLVTEIPLEVQEGEHQETKPYLFSDERVGAVQIFRDTWRNGDEEICRTRLEACRIENREFELAEGFKDLGHDHPDSTKTWDWVTLSRLPAVSTSPEGWNILALQPLPSLRPPGLALALLNSPGGILLSHIDLTDSPESTSEKPWTALRGSQVRIADDVGMTNIGICLSQGVARGELGLVAIVSKEYGAILTLGPELGSVTAETGGDVSLLERAKNSARSIVLAMEQGQNWADVVRASLASESHSERTELGEEIIRQSHRQLQNNINLDELSGLLELQTAIYGMLHDPRHTTASELVRLLEASNIFTRCATKGQGKTITFDLASVWPLIAVADWVGGVLAEMMRSVISARGQLEWTDGVLSTDNTPVRLLYLAHPALRSLMIRLHSQLNAFTHFVLSIDRPIAHPIENGLQGMPDPRATILAKANVVDVLGREGVDLIQWGKAIEGLPQSDSFGTNTTEALLRLSCEPLENSTPGILTALPTPSALLRSNSRFVEHDYDAITYEPLARDASRLARCDRCGWKTVALGDQGWLGLGAWGEWRREQETICLCGGTWIREAKRGT